MVFSALQDSGIWGLVAGSFPFLKKFVFNSRRIMKAQTWNQGGSLYISAYNTFVGLCQGQPMLYRFSLNSKEKKRIEAKAILFPSIHYLQYDFPTPQASPPAIFSVFHIKDFLVWHYQCGLFNSFIHIQRRVWITYKSSCKVNMPINSDNFIKGSYLPVFRNDKYSDIFPP